MKCRGWKAGHTTDRLVRVEIRYEGALSFPSTHAICLECLRPLVRFAAELDATYGRKVCFLKVDYYPPEEQPVF